MLSDPGYEANNSVAVQKGLEIVHIAFVDSALGQDNDVDAVDLVSGCHNSAAHKIQVELFRRYELEEAEGLLFQSLLGGVKGAEVGLPHP